jgi:hypothetical protein
MRRSMIFVLLALLLVNAGVALAQVQVRISLSTGGYVVAVDSVRFLSGSRFVYETPGFGGPRRSVDTMTFDGLPSWPTELKMWTHLGSDLYIDSISPVVHDSTYSFNVAAPAPQFIVSQLTGIEESQPLNAVTTGLRCSPMPFRSNARLQFSMNAAGSALVEVFDAAGNLVRTLADRSIAAGEHAVTWDGRDGDGRRVCTGIYLARLTVGSGRTLTKLVLTD